MKIIQTPLPGVIVIEPRVFGDQRGFFLESYHQERYEQAGIRLPFVQDNHSRSSLGVLRGLHFQLTHPQGKLVRVSMGVIFDVVVDIRFGSPHFGKWYGAELSSENHRQMYIPPGFAHGFYVLSEQVDFLYKCTDYYHPEDEGGIQWNDPDINIHWPLSNPVLSARDCHNPRLRDLSPEQLPVFCDSP